MWTKAGCKNKLQQGTVAATNAGRNAFEPYQIASSLAIKSHVCNTFPVVLVIWSSCVDYSVLTQTQKYMKLGKHYSQELNIFRNSLQLWQLAKRIRYCLNFCQIMVNGTRLDYAKRLVHFGGPPSPSRDKATMVYIWSMSSYANWGGKWGILFG
jgi:hypothetical protein